MTINKYSLWHNIRTISSGLFIVGLFIVPVLFMGATNTPFYRNYLTYMSLSLIGIIIGTVMTIKYRSDKAISSNLKKRQNVYGLIALALISIPGIAFIIIAIALRYTK
jgi:archaellum biogenesis protein FlaJ (TadC family)